MYMFVTNIIYEYEYVKLSPKYISLKTTYKTTDGYYYVANYNMDNGHTKHHE